MSRRALACWSIVASLALSGCSGDNSPGPAPASPATPAASSSAPPTASAAPRPANKACYDLDFKEAVAPTNAAKPVDCARAHTAMTYDVGTLDTVVDGHLLAVDSRQVQEQVSTVCPHELSRFLGGTPDALHLSMLRAVWFTPTVDESDAGADWYRCDVIALATDGELVPLTGRLAGVLAEPAGRDRYAMCGTAEPGTPDFSRVVCSRGHSWRAVRTVELPDGRYPGEAAAREAGQEPCKDAGREAASDSLDFEWGYEWPTEKQWKAGQTWGLCWIPD